MRAVIALVILLTAVSTSAKPGVSQERKCADSVDEIYEELLRHHRYELKDTSFEVWLQPEEPQRDEEGSVTVWAKDVRKRRLIQPLLISTGKDGSVQNIAWAQEGEIASDAKKRALVFRLTNGMAVTSNGGKMFAFEKTHLLTVFLPRSADNDEKTKEKEKRQKKGTKEGRKQESGAAIR